MERSEMEKKVREDEDFVHSPKHQNSLNRFLAKNENPLENGAIGRLLLIAPEEVEALYQQSVVQLKEEMAVDEETD